MHQAHPPRIRWHVETHDPLANEWSSGLPLLDRQAAIGRRTHLDETRPTWKDGTPVQRRIVLETTTFEDLNAEPSHLLARFPKSGFVLTGVGGQDLAAVPDRTPDGRPAIRFSVGSSETGHADVVLPLELLEEVIAGQREISRQARPAAAPTAACQCLPASPTEGPLTCDTHLPKPEAGPLSVAERQFLTFALDLAANYMAAYGESTDEKEAALARLRQLAAEE
ncbi:hypothetical protein ACIGBH_27500 [Streptomyces sp. NPDC085929]|uniref:hypothetical protein n=1 Tax=Streptomyces sp. NPDC085929 TaxID=3365739 RepID=UPI0037D084FB